MTDVGETGKSGAAAKMESNAISGQNLCEIVIERENDKPATKWAKKDWESRHHSEITEACVQDLGFSIIEQNGEKRKSLRLLWRPKNYAKTLEDDFFIVAKGDHEIVLGLDAYDKWFQASNPGAYLCFMNKVPEETLKKREQESKIRHEQEIAAQKAKWLEILQKELQCPLSHPPAPRL